VKPYYEHAGITIYHADFRDFSASLEANSIDMVFTDPPYGHNNNDGDLIHRWEAALGRGESGPARSIANDGPEANDLVRFAFEVFQRVLKPGCCCCCCCGGGGPDPQFARWSLWLDEAVGFKQAIVWDKGGLGMGWHYRRNYEMVLVGEKSGAACRWYGGSSQSNVVRINGIKPQAWDHPTPKPEALPSLFITLHSLPGDLILDPFMGGGSTLTAAKVAGRRAIGVEIEEKYCEMAARRLEQEAFDFAPTAPPPAAQESLPGFA
jgi:site-specific DNA-methyltransferase (adenine-specific)